MKRISQWLVSSFLKGAVIVLPVVLSIYALVNIGSWLDSLVGLQTPGLGLAVVVLGMVGIGAFASNRLGAALVRLLQGIMERLPLLKMVYSAIRDVVEALMGNKKQFDNPVIISLNEAGDIKTLGFISMQQQLSATPGFVAVYVPQSFNVAGNLILVPEDRVEKLEMEPAAVMALIFSGGIVQKNKTRPGAGSVNPQQDVTG